jgi:hypothetical protein
VSSKSSKRPLTVADLATLSPEEKAALRGVARASRRARIRRARLDPSVFCEFVLRDEQTGRRIRQAPMHSRWHGLIDSHPRLVLWSHVDAGKTNQISIGRVLWELGRDPSLRVVVISKTNLLAMKIVRAIGKYIRDSPDVREVFPGLRPAEDISLPNTSHMLTVERPTIAKDPSVQASGVYGNILGGRIDLLILDDVVDHTNTRTSTPRDHLWAWVRSTLFGRLTAKARVVAMANAWHPEDLPHRLEKEPRFVGFRFPVMASNGDLTWPEHWPRTRIDEQRQDMGALEFARALMCQARDDESARFKREWINKCLAKGQGKSCRKNRVDVVADLVAEGIIREDDFEEEAANDTLRRLGGKPIYGPSALRFYTGVDLAVSKKDSADLTVFFTIVVLPDETRRVVEILSGRMSGPEIVDTLYDVNKRFDSISVVENNAAQDFILQFARERGVIPIRPFTTGKQKAHPEFGVESLAAEFEAGKWVIPCSDDGGRDREIDAWVSELHHYDPSQHTGDRVMAGWFAREGAREGDNVHRGGVTVGIRILGDDK